MQLSEAIQAFGRGFTFTRSFTHPFLLEQVGPLWVMRDAPRPREEYRTEEWLVAEIAAKDADPIIRANCRGRFAVCALQGLSEATEGAKASYKRLGYRLRTTEKLFVHDFAEIPDLVGEVDISRVTTQTQADLLTKAARTRQILPEHLTQVPPKLRQYVALDMDEPVGWVRSVAAGESAWCSNMYVMPSHRRRGIAQALMVQMLRDDKAAGFKQSVLLASHAGALLYPTVGYRLIGELCVFVPGPGLGRA